MIKKGEGTWLGVEWNCPSLWFSFFLAPRFRFRFGFRPIQISFVSVFTLLSFLSSVLHASLPSYHTTHDAQYHFCPHPFSNFRTLLLPLPSSLPSASAPALALRLLPLPLPAFRYLSCLSPITLYLPCLPYLLSTPFHDSRFTIHNSTRGLPPRATIYLFLSLSPSL